MSERANRRARPKRRGLTLVIVLFSFIAAAPIAAALDPPVSQADGRIVAEPEPLHAVQSPGEAELEEFDEFVIALRRVRSIDDDSDDQRGRRNRQSDLRLVEDDPDPD